MEVVEIGKIKVLVGEDGGRFPFNNSLFIDDRVKVIVDPGASLGGLMEIRSQNSIDLVINTHYHFDHIAYNYIFKEAKIYLNEIESECFINREAILQRLGMIDFYGKEWAQGWLERISRPDTPQSPYSPQNRHEWWLSTARLDGTYQWGEIFDFGTTRMEVIGTPGHTAGFNCLFFPDEGVVYTGDIDLTKFGPWYGGEDSDIEQYIDSAWKIAKLNADFFVTGHEVGILKKEEFVNRLEKFLDIIERRDIKVLSVLGQPMDLNEIANMGLFYARKFLIDEWVRVWNAIKTRKHLERLERRGIVKQREGKFERVL